MLKKDYSKKRIINLARKYGNLEYEFNQTTLEKRLDNIIEFLNKKAVKDLLENLDNSFYIKVMNITKAKGGAYDSYDFNVVDAIFLGVLISLFTHPVFKKIRSIDKPKTISLNEEWDWIEEFRSKLLGFTDEWDNYEREVNDNKRLRKVRKVNLNEIDDREIKLNFLKIKQKQREEDPLSWEVVNVNIQSLLYTLTMTDRKRKENENRQVIEELIKLFDALPDHHQVVFYKKKMEDRIKYIRKDLDLYIEELKINEPDEYKLHVFRKNLNEIDEKLQD